ncbi:hypothetical protein LEP1GSC061_4150 [Leptospira wolffii serovar Khorat str. Khorat-H2]|nr:hypothetical protein LEP1GSC061_4150 [Leptospira wolffii serovar Khorat str. Khorat-H2]
MQFFLYAKPVKFLTVFPIYPFRGSGAFSLLKVWYLKLMMSAVFVANQ